MPISVVVRTNYTNEELERWAGGSVNRICDIGRSDRSRFPLLYGIDPYGNTWFNCRQMEQMVDELYLSALSRYPTPKEKTEILQTLAAAPAAERRAALEDLSWGVLSSTEFLLNH